jgi:hypothetical protein
MLVINLPQYPLPLPKMRNSICAFILLFSLGLSANEPIRTWTDDQGRKIQAKLINFSEDKVTLEMNGKEFALPLSLFSETDQKYAKNANLSSSRPDGSLPQNEMIQILENRIVALEEEKVARMKEYEEFIDVMRTETKKTIAELQNEIRRADAEGYKRGIAEMMAKYEKSSTSTSPQLPTSSIAEKLERIEIPRVDFFQSPLSDAMMELQRLSKKFDLTEPVPAKKGVQIFVKSKGNKEPNVNISLNPMPLGNIIQFITEMIGWKYEVRPDAVVLEINDSSNLKTQQFSFDTELVQLMKKQILAEYNPANDPFAPKDKIKFMKTEEPREIIKEFFNYIGVGFNEFKGHKLKIEESLIYVTQTVPHMERIKESFALLNEAN